MKFIRCSTKMTRLRRIFGAGALIIVAVQLIATRTAFASGMAQQNLRGESELPWLFAVYIITWAAFFGYIFMLSRRQREMRREIDALKRALADRVTKN